MKKIVSILALAAFLFSATAVPAQNRRHHRRHHRHHRMHHRHHRRHG
ncbi:MAG TPA: hypothetical protein VE713_10830 [Pyrinomonadaceae bacterium]|nr:hypothetical protein [Pyrinomonadaceae bacterium]